MGYEIKAFVVERYNYCSSDAGTSNEPECLHILGMVDLSTIGRLSHFGKLRNHYFDNPIENGRVFGLWEFGHNSDDKRCISEDCYGDAIVLIPIKKAIKALKTDHRQNSSRCFLMLLELLEATIKGSPENTDGLFVACYRY